MNKPKTTIRQIQLNYEALIALLQGKTVGISTLLPNGDQFVVEIKPPFDGMFLTFDEIDQLRYQAQMGVFDVMDKLRGQGDE